MNVLSLFDGMSCGQQALERAGIKVDNYFASEIDKYAIQVTMANYPNTIQLGSVVDVDGCKLPKIDLLIGGSPCQSFSFAGKRKGMSTKDEQEILTLEHYLQLKKEGFEFEGQSYLFWEYMRLLNEVKPKYFLLENVMMGEKWEKVLSKAIGVKPIMINSALVSAQNRQRLYWFGQIRERLFFNDNYCYICRNNNDHDANQNKRILGETQNKREEKVLGETQGRQEGLCSLQSRVFEDNSERYDKNLFKNLPIGVKKDGGKEQEQGNEKGLCEKVSRNTQGATIGISEKLQKNAKRQRGGEEIGVESIKENCKNNENAFASSSYWTKEEAEQRRINYHSKYGKEVCCVQCGKRINHRPYTSFVKGWNKLAGKSPSTLSEVQFNEARQNNGRIFDILEIGVMHEDLFGETLLPIEQPKDRGILLKDILEQEVDQKYFLSEKMIAGFISHSNKKQSEGCGFKFSPTDGNKKSCTITNPGKNRMDDNYIVHNMMPRSSIIGNGSTGLVSINSNIRRLTPIECERLQTVKDNYTNYVSDSQRYKMLGNGWTIEVIKHIFSYLEL